MFPVVKGLCMKKDIKAIELPEWVDYMAELITQKYKNLKKRKTDITDGLILVMYNLTHIL